jgi:hypothetical protein
MRALGALFWLLAIPLAVHAQSPSVDRAVTAGAGIYDVAIKTVVEDKNRPEHSWYSVTAVKLLRATTSVPARLCTSFGFKYLIVGSLSKADVPIRMVTKFPAPGLHKPETLERIYEQETVVSRTIGRVYFRSYTFESSWELLPGTWTFEFWHQNRKLAEQSFTVTPPCAECAQTESPKRPCEGKLVAMADR